MPLLALAKSQGGGDLSFLKPGQLLSAQVLGRSGDGSISIKLSERVLKVVSDLQLIQGTKINVKVEVKQGQLMLRLITPQTQAPLTPTPQDALRQVLPKQQPLQPLFTQLTRIAVQVEGTQPVPARTKSQGTTTPTTSPTTSPAPQRLSASAYNNSITSSALLRSDKGLLNATTQLTLPPLPPKVEQAIASLLKQLPSNARLTQPEGLKQAVNNSGIFFENRLINGADKPALSGDLKTILFRAASLIRSTLQSLPPPTASLSLAPQATSRSAARQTPQAKQVAAQAQASAVRQAETQSLLQLLGKQTESALARIQTNQLSSLQAQQQSNDTVLSLEIPLFNGKESEVLELKIRRESRRQREEAEAIWSVTLKLDNDDYGTIRAVVTLIGKKVSTTFWCEQGETQQLFAQRMEELRQRINEQGLEIGRTQAFTGVPPEPDGPNGLGNPNNNDGIFRTQA